MTENLKAFYRTLSEDEELGREFKELVDRLRASRMEAIIGFAESHGLELTPDDFVPEPVEGEISEEELTVVTGGYTVPVNDDPECGIAAPGPDFSWLWV